MPTPHDLTYTLPADAHYHIVRNAIGILPPPPDPSPDAEARRNNAFIARVADLQPQGSAEVELAAAFVTCMELARDAVLLSRSPELPFAIVLKCRAQATSMYRQANSASRELRHLKEARAKAASLPELSGRGERAEHLTTVLMAEGLSNPPPPVLLAEPEPAQPVITAIALEPAHPALASHHNAESHYTKTEIPSRQPAPPALIPKSARPASVSYRDPESPHTKTETPPRHPAPHSFRPPPTPNQPPKEPLVGAWRLAHLFPAHDDIPD